MDKKDSEALPYKVLGKRLKALRDLAKETLAEASGSVEIDVKQLASIELGHSRPAEEILLLLISHFGVKDDEAVKLWELAGYGMAKLPMAHMTSDEIQAVQNPNGAEKQILFTDIVDVIVNNYGVVMKFMQSTGPKSSPAVVAKVGMSREHAKSVLQILQVTLSQTERSAPRLPKKMITPDSSTPDDKTKN